MVVERRSRVEDRQRVDAFEERIDQQIIEQGQRLILSLKICGFDDVVTSRQRQELQRRYEEAGWVVTFGDDPDNGDHLIIFS